MRKLSRSYGELVSCLRHLPKDNTLLLFDYEDDFKRDEKFSLYVLDKRCQKHCPSLQKVFIIFRSFSETAHAIAAWSTG